MSVQPSQGTPLYNPQPTPPYQKIEGPLSFDPCVQIHNHIVEKTDKALRESCLPDLVYRHLQAKKGALHYGSVACAEVVATILMAERAVYIDSNIATAAAVVGVCGATLHGKLARNLSKVASVSIENIKYNDPELGSAIQSLPRFESSFQKAEMLLKERYPGADTSKFESRRIRAQQAQYQPAWYQAQHPPAW